MPNNWNYLFEGLAKGLDSFGKGMQERAEKQKAKEQFNSAMESLNQMNKKREDALNYAMELSGAKQFTPYQTQTTGAMDGTIPTWMQDVIKQKATETHQTNLDTAKKEYSGLETKYLDTYGSLANSKYGAGYTKVLDKLDKEEKPKYEIVNGKDGSVLAVNPYNPREMVELKSGKIDEPKWKIDTQFKPYAYEEDGKYYVKRMLVNAETGENKYDTFEVKDKSEWDYWKAQNPTFFEKKDYENQLKVNFKMQFPSGSKGSGRSTPEEKQMGANLAWNIMKGYRKHFLSNGTIPDEMLNQLKTLGVNPNLMNINFGNYLWDKFKGMSEKQIIQYIAENFFNY